MKKRQTIKTPFIKKPDRICKYVLDSPHPEDEVSFNYLSIPFPYYHFHDHWEILIVIDGAIIHTINGKTYSMKIGDACFLKPADAHYFTFESENNVKTLTLVIHNVRTLLLKEIIVIHHRRVGIIREHIVMEVRFV